MARSQVATAAVLLAVAVAAWAAVVAQLAGMGAMPWASPEAIGPWTETWVVMMAAMMLPGLVPAVVRRAGAGRSLSSRPASSRSGLRQGCSPTGCSR